MTTRAPTAKQLAARKKFAERVRRGDFKRKITNAGRARLASVSKFKKNKKPRRVSAGSFTAKQRKAARAVLRGTSDVMTLRQAGEVLGAKRYVHNPKWLSKLFPRTTAAAKKLRTPLPRQPILKGEKRDGEIVYFAGDRFTPNRNMALRFTNDRAAQQKAEALKRNHSVRKNLVRLYWE